MSFRIHHYTVDAADFDEFVKRRAAVVAAVRKEHPGLAEARLIRLGDNSYTDIWRWDSAAQMGAAFAALPAIPEAPAALSLTRDAAAVNGEIVDEQ